MNIEDVKKLPPLERFLYWITERHRIYLKRKAGDPAPWTDDEILRTYYFTNPYRENDRTTVWFRENVRDPLRDDPRVLFATVAFRWFNLIETGKLLWEYGDTVDGCCDLLTHWNPKLVLSLLSLRRSRGEQVFTGAYMINSPGGRGKLEAIVERITNVWEEREHLTARWDSAEGSMEGMRDTLMTFPGLGGFMAYEIVCDLRYTYLLEQATDKLTWCNPGPGCARGLHRIEGKEWASKGNNATSPPLPANWLETMKDLLTLCRRRPLLRPAFEMREVEHSLCEWDKYERALWGDGRLKRRYKGG